MITYCTKEKREFSFAGYERVKNLLSQYKQKIKFLRSKVNYIKKRLISGEKYIIISTKEDKYIHHVKENINLDDTSMIFSDISCVEYLVHVSILYIELFLNKDNKITMENYNQIEIIVKEVLEYFDDWYKFVQTMKKNKKDKSWERLILARLTYNNTRIGICGF